MPDVPIQRQAKLMRELRESQNRVASAYRERDELMVAWSLSDSLSRPDMARACGLAKSRVDQIIRDTFLQDQASRSSSRRAAVARHIA